MLTMKKGDKVIMKGFTGIKLGVFEVTGATKKTVSITKKNGEELVFDRKTGKQINVEEGKEKYANSIMEDDGSFVPPSTAGSKRKKAEKVTKKVKAAEPEETNEEEDEDEDVAPAKKPAKKATKKKPAKKPEPEEEEDDDFEDDEDDDFEEVDD